MRSFRGFPRGTELSDDFHGLVGRTPVMKDLFLLLDKVARDNCSTILIQGESGTGKELVARAIHAMSPRKGKNLVPVNCAAIPDELLESELFGYVKGAFTGAAQSKMGRIQYAEGGTLFLDEIGDMKPALQAKLLRMLQEQEIEPVGSVKPVKTDVRILAATHRDLEQAVEKGLFREDLYYRLCVIPIAVPPLRRHSEDVPLLIERFALEFASNRGAAPVCFDPAATAVLKKYPWPGNIRELRNLVQRMAIIHSGMTVRAKDLPEKYTEHLSTEGSDVEVPELNPEGVDFNTLISNFEDRLILQALSRTGGNKKEAAELLNLKRTTLIEKIKKKKLSIPFTKNSREED